MGAGCSPKQAPLCLEWSYFRYTLLQGQVLILGRPHSEGITLHLFSSIMEREVDMHELDTARSSTGSHVEVRFPLQVRIYIPRASNSSPWEEHNSLMERLESCMAPE